MTTWTERGAISFTCVKPTLSSLEVEFDAETLSLVDGATVVTWLDQSGNSNDATGVNSPEFEAEGWGGTLPSVRLIGDETFGFTGGIGNTGPFVNSDFTFFIVGQALDIDNYIALVGSVAGLSPLFPKKISIFIQPDGSIVFHQTDEVSFNLQPGSNFSVESAAGLISNGDKFIITARFSQTLGKDLRLNGTRIGVNTRATRGMPQEYVTPRLGKIYPQENPDVVGVVTGDDKRLAWVSGYNQYAADVEVSQMENYLAGLWNFSGFSTSPKPAIANPEIEYNANSLTDADGATISTWADDSGEGNNAVKVDGTPSMETVGWGGGTRCIRLKNSPNLNHFTFDGSGFIGTNMTIFAVARFHDLSANNFFLGGSSAAALSNLLFFVITTGAVRFAFNSGGGPNSLDSGTGEVLADGSCYVITARHSNTEGKLIRANSIKIAEDTDSTSNLVAYTDPFISRFQSNYSPNMQLAWLSGYTTALTDAQMSSMEDYLYCRFCQELANSEDLSIWSERSDPT